MVKINNFAKGKSVKLTVVRRSSYLVAMAIILMMLLNSLGVAFAAQDDNANRNTEQNEQIVRHYFEALNDHNIGDARRFLTSNFTDTVDGILTPICLDCWTDQEQQLLQTFPDIKFHIDGIIAQNNSVGVLFDWQGTDAANGRHVNVWGTSRFILNDERITSETEIIDSGNLQAQISGSTTITTNLAATVDVKEGYKNAETNTAVIQGRLAAFNDHSIPEIVAQLDPSYSAVFDGNTAPIDQNGWLNLANGFFSVFPDFKVYTDGITAEGNSVLIFYHFNSTFAPTGTQISVHAQTWFTVKNGKITQQWDRVYNQDLGIELGAPPTVSCSQSM